MASTRVRTLEQELAHALRTGPFSALLNLAIEASALSLEQLQQRLAEQNIHVSLSTLSYWRRGRSRPERPDSLRAVHILEKILDLPADSLIAQLGPRRPRGRWLTHSPGSLDLVTAFGGSDELTELLREVDTPVHNGLTRLSVHDLLAVGPDREDLGLTTRIVFRAVADRVGRFTVAYRQYDLDREPARLQAIRGCRLGRVRRAPSGEFLVADLALDRVLAIGETAVVEYQAFGLDSGDTDFYHRVFAMPVGEYVLQIQFDPAAQPSRCWRYERRIDGGPDQRVREVWLGSTQAAHVVATDVPPGVVGMRWEWE